MRFPRWVNGSASCAIGGLGKKRPAGLERKAKPCIRIPKVVDTQLPLCHCTPIVCQSDSWYPFNLPASGVRLVMLMPQNSNTTGSRSRILVGSCSVCRITANAPGQLVHRRPVKKLRCVRAEPYPRSEESHQIRRRRTQCCRHSDPKPSSDVVTRTNSLAEQPTNLRRTYTSCRFPLPRRTWRQEVRRLKIRIIWIEATPKHKRRNCTSSTLRSRIGGCQ